MPTLEKFIVPIGPQHPALKEPGHFEFAVDGETVTSANVNLRVRIPRENASIPSICSAIPAATFFERELSEMFGIIVLGTPTPDRLFLPDEWPTNAPPLRKDFVMPQM